MNDGILITEGATFRLTGFSITINEATGEVTADGGKPMIHYDVCPAWLTIAIDHLKDAKLAREAMLLAKDAPDKGLKFQALEREFRASMQAVTSSAIAIDAFYAVVKQTLVSDMEPFDPEKRGNRRSARISETLRQGFQLNPQGFTWLRETIEEIFKFRNQAVHPTGTFNDPVLHPELNVGVERRQVVFRYDNAFKIVQAAVSIITELAAKGIAKNSLLKEYARSLETRLDPIRAEPLLGLPPFEK
jgi:hypothetical protein